MKQTTILLCLAVLFVGAVHASIDVSELRNRVEAARGRWGRRGSRVEEAGGRYGYNHRLPLDSMLQQRLRDRGERRHRMMRIPGTGEEEMMAHRGHRRGGGGGAGGGMHRAAEHLRRQAGRGHHRHNALANDLRGNLAHFQQMHRGQGQGHWRRGQGHRGFPDLARFEVGMQHPGRMDLTKPDEEPRRGNLNWASGGSHRPTPNDFRGHRRPMREPRGHRFMIGDHRRGYGMGAP